MKIKKIAQDNSIKEDLVKKVLSIPMISNHVLRILVERHPEIRKMVEDIAVDIKNNKIANDIVKKILLS